MSADNFYALLPSRIILSFLGTATAFGGYLADWNETHVSLVLSMKLSRLVSQIEDWR